jgi:hypothetical protein
VHGKLTAGLALAAMLALVLIAAGCGGGEDHLTKAEFLKQGNAICRKGNHDIEGTAKKQFGNQRPSPSQLKKFATGTLIPSVQSQIDQIRDLAAPSGDEDKVNAILDEAQGALDKGKKDPIILVSEKNDPFNKANKLAKSYGLTVCAGS